MVLQGQNRCSHVTDSQWQQNNSLKTVLRIWIFELWKSQFACNISAPSQQRSAGSTDISTGLFHKPRVTSHSVTADLSTWATRGPPAQHAQWTGDRQGRWVQRKVDVHVEGFMITKLHKIIQTRIIAVGFLVSKISYSIIMRWTAPGESTKITEVNLSVFVYRLFHEVFSPILETFCI